MKRLHQFQHGAPRAKRPEPDSSSSTAAPTRERLLAVGRQLFARHGYEGASVRDITTAAGANLGAITYWFTSKHLLYMHILQGMVGPLARELTFILKPDRPALERIERVVRQIFQHIGRNPDMPQFMVREMSAPKPSEPLLSLMGTVLPLMEQAIIEGQRDGSIRPGEPRLMTLSIFAQPVYLYLTRNATKVPMDDARIVEHAVAFVHAGLEQR